jgi:type I restriction enzyme, S subunit
MSTWPLVRLGEVVRHRNEFIAIDDLTRYRRPRVQLHAQGIVLRDEVVGALIKTKRQQVCRSGEFLVAEIDAKVGGYGIVPVELEGSIVSSHYFLFVLDESTLDRRFLDYFIRTPAFHEQVAAQGSTNYAAIRPAHVLDYRIPLLPLEEQRRIVALIEELATQVHEAHSLRHQAVEEAEVLLRTARRAIISNSGVETVALQEACAAIIDNLHSNPRLAESGIPCVRSPDVGYGTLDLHGAQRTDEQEYRRRTIRGEPKVDDIVLVREGGGTGKCALVLPGQRFSLGQRVMMLRPNAAKILPRFFMHQLLSPLVQEEQIIPLSKGSASPHLNIGALKRFSLRLPPLSEQHQIVAYLDRLQAQVDALRLLQAETAVEIDALLPSILDKAFKGALPV